MRSSTLACYDLLNVAGNLMNSESVIRASPETATVTAVKSGT